MEDIRTTISVADAAKLIGRTQRTVRRYCDDGKLVASKIRRDDGVEEWLIDRASLNALIDGLAKDTQHVRSVKSNARIDEVTNHPQPSPDVQAAVSAVNEALATVRVMIETQSRMLPPTREEADRLRTERDSAQTKLEAALAKNANLQAEIAVLRDREARTQFRRSWWTRLFGGRNANE